MASNKNTTTYKKLNKNKLLYMKQQLTKSIAGCYGCSQCRELHEELHKVNILLGIPSKPPNFNYLDLHKSK